MKIKRNNLIFVCSIVLGIILIFISFFIIFDEMTQAKEFCDSINETYHFLPNLKHKCDWIPIYKYNSKFIGEYWDFSSRESFDIALPKI